MLKKVTQSLLALIMLAQVLIPTTTVFASEAEYEYTYGDELKFNDFEYEDIYGEGIDEIEDVEAWTDGELIEWDELLEANTEVRDQSAYLYEYTEFNEEAVDLRATHIELYEASNLLREDEVFELAFVDVAEALVNNTESFEALIEDFATLLEAEEVIEEESEIAPIPDDVVDIPELGDDIVLTPAAEEFSVTVVRGVASANRNPGDLVTVTANAPSSGYRFSHWTVTDGVALVNVNNRVASFNMPSRNVTVTAHFVRLTSRLTISNGRGGNSGTAVSVTGGRASARAGGRYNIRATARSGWEFVRWAGGNASSFGNRNRANTTFTMPMSGVNVTLTPIFRRRRAANLSTNFSQRAFVRSGNTAFRSGPGNRYYLNGRLPIGTEIRVRNLGRNGWRFVEVRSGSRRGQRGWVPTSRLSVVRSEAAVIRDRAPFRRGPGTSGTANRVISRLPMGRMVNILGTTANGGWTLIQNGQRQGWIRSNQLRAIKIQNATATDFRPLHLRAAPRTDARRVRSTIFVDVISRAGRWSLVEDTFDGRRGWVRTNRLLRATGQLATGSSMVLHRGPTRDSRRHQRTLPAGSYALPMNHTTLDGNWIRVRVGGRTGWIGW